MGLRGFMKSNVEQEMHVLKMNTIVAYLDKILVCNGYFDVHLDKLKCVLLVLGKDILIFGLNKYLSCTFDPGLLVFVLSIQEREVQLLRNESIDRAQQPEIWRSFVVQTGYIGDASTGVQSKTDISTFRRSFVMNLISLEIQLTKVLLRLGIT
ncbi:hypothetical protein YC2023_081948 [Brassica napus]